METNVSNNWRIIEVAAWIIAACSLAVGLAMSIGGLYSLVPLFFMILGFWTHQKSSS